MNISKGALIRTIVLFIALVNTFALMMGKELLPVGEGEVEATVDLVYAAISGIVLFISVIVAWWKNNSFTPEARAADERLKQLKNAKKRY